ncbi:MAG TPA: hypothetical protein VM658_00560 [bacterium]|nr:hypothetical protein [bacterium]
MMKSYLADKTGQKMGVTRAGMPKEVYFEGVLRELGEDFAVFTDGDGREIALPLDKILVIGPAPDAEESRRKPGF